MTNTNKPPMLYAVNWWANNRPGQRWETFTPDEDEQYEGVVLMDDHAWTIGEHLDADAAYIAQYAPEMAEYIHRKNIERAKLHYEYAVQVNERRNRDADWWYWKDNMRTQWFTDYEEAVNVAESIPESARIVRRLVGEPEVTE